MVSVFSANHSLVVLLSLAVSGLVCNFDSEPYFENELDFKSSIIESYCTSELLSDYSCKLAVYDRNSLVQVNPDRDFIKDVGVVDSFQSTGNLVTVSFRPELNVVRAGVWYNVSVICGNRTVTEVYNSSVRPVFRNLDRIAEIGVGQINNSAVWVGLLAVISFLFFGIVVLVRLAFNG